jgi:cytidine deaminase
MKQVIQDLIDVAKTKANKRELTPDVTIGHVGCAIKTKSGKIYTGTSISTSANLGHCAEVTAIAQMINEGETEIEYVVGVGGQGELITPCGRCRELMFQINRSNLKALIALSEDKTVTLEELLPHRWQDYWAGGRD